MREVFNEQLEQIFDDLARITDLVEVAVKDATTALLTGDATVAQQVISDDDQIDRARAEVEEAAFEIISRQAPVAGDLRSLIAALRMVSELERMGDLSVHVAKIARLRVPNLAVPVSVRPTIVGMSEVAIEMVDRVGDIIRDQDVNRAFEMQRIDERMDMLRRSSFSQLLGSDWQDGVEAAVDIALLGRYYERIADHAVSIANRVVFVVTGENVTKAS